MTPTFVIPVYNERPTLETLAAGICEHAAPHDYRIIFVDDGSTDGSDAVLAALHEANPAIDVIRFRRNRGKSAALAAGFARARGDVIITMDADLQDDPAEIGSFLTKLDEGFDVVCGWKRTRRDPWHKTIPSRYYNAAIARLFGLDLHDVNCGFKALRREVIDAIPMYGELHRLVPVLAANEGFRVTEIPVEHHPRRHGVSKYGFERFVRGAADVVTVMFIAQHGRSPAHFFGGLGLVLLAMAVVLKVAALVLGFWCQNTFLGLALLMGAVWAGVCGILLPAVGLVAELVVRESRKDVDPLAGASLMEHGERPGATTPGQEKC